jgi:hypothetical protein
VTFRESSHLKTRFAISMANFENMVFSMGHFICPIFTKIISCRIFHVFLDVLPMMVIALSNFGLVKSYGSICRVLYSDALGMLLGKFKVPFHDFEHFM